MKRTNLLSVICCLLLSGNILSASTDISPDSVRFEYCGQARRVKLSSNLFFSLTDSLAYSDNSRSVRMHCDSDSCFSVTVPLPAPGMYTYCFYVDGKHMPDPQNPDTAWQKTRLWNVLTVGGTPQADLYLQPAQQGQVIRTQWYSPVEQLLRRVNIYLPAAYIESNLQSPTSNLQFPVLYLIHGINGYEGSWAERGRAIQILENMLAQGQCPPMILVMPDVNICVKDDRPSHHTLWNNVFNYPILSHSDYIEKALVALIAYVDSTFCVSDEHYIAGLSDGARMAANTANMLPGYFSAVGLFSPVVHKDQLPETNANAVYYIYSGKGDMFHPNAKQFNRRLDKAHIPHEYTETDGGHTWRNWRLYLADYMAKIGHNHTRR